MIFHKGKAYAQEDHVLLSENMVRIRYVQNGLNRFPYDSGGFKSAGFNLLKEFPERFISMDEDC